MCISYNPVCACELWLLGAVPVEEGPLARTALPTPLAQELYSQGCLHVNL